MSVLDFKDNVAIQASDFARPCLPVRVKHALSRNDDAFKLEESRIWHTRHKISVNCELIWETFRESFAYKPPCDVSPDDYADLPALVNHTLKKDNIVLWEGTRMYELVTQYADYGRRYTSMADILSGYLVDGLVWCGTATDPGYENGTCPEYESCKGHAEKAYWQQLSRTFAETIEGDVIILLNGSAPQAFFNDSVLGEYEIPNLKQNKINNIVIYTVHEIGMPIRERCGEGSVKVAEDLIREFGHAVRCEDNPEVMLGG
ncbi:hypothetical protein CAPTEDRAFT_213010 [Capitella teleta]|uniref:Uncharacterized protein n=1 Tax=Capitella teleta TaxID=283909 RepID=R7TMH6_CAPTE|nr:hypothetical protein CAPTEDRAFT_213010 [Capitella teleta]|eukprot:ELT94819.1 hypothetical protein CAPTEDRAFT_213010 [Capitella teleta]